ncbi:MAG TPA: mismatch-specific DNA-glycosylase [Chthonomonadales bacterium]|nr:mismatch-specific DNA-glycosylase [Chthonomonadales bacterium]
MNAPRYSISKGAWTGAVPGAEQEDLLPEIVAPGLDVIFVGAAPSYHAARIGHYYAGPANRFWLLLSQAGLTPLPLLPEQDHEVLAYGIGLFAIFPHLCTSDNSLLPVPSPELRDRVRRRLLELSPRFVCYNGKDVFRMATGIVTCRWGLQTEPLGRSSVFVVPSSSGRADAWAADRLYLFRELRSLLSYAGV